MHEELQKFLQSIQKDVDLLLKDKLPTSLYIEVASQIDIWLKEQKNDNRSNK